MIVKFGIQWLFIIGVSALWMDYTLAAEIPTSDVETKLDGVVVNDAFHSNLLSQIRLVKMGYIQMVYSIQRNESTTYSPTLMSTLDNKLEPVTVCVVSEDELKEIQNVLDAFGKDPDIPEIKHETSSSCTELEQIKFGILKLKNAYLELLKHQTTPVMYEELKASYEAKLKEFQKKMDDAVKNATDQERAKAEKLQEELQAQDARINELLKTLDEQKIRINDLNIRLCASQLNNRRIDDALDTYNNNSISEEERMPRVIEEAYNDSTFNTLFDFINKTGDSVSKLYGYTTLFDKMKSNNHMSSLNLLILTNGVGKNKESEFSKLQDSLEESLKVMHRNEDYKTFFDFVPQRPSNLSDEIANGIMPIFVRGAYNNDPENVENILKMQSEFVDIPLRLYLFRSLIAEMKNRGHTNGPKFSNVMFDVISIRKELIPKADNFAKEIFEQIYETVPENLRPLMYKNLCIQNTYNEFMVTADEVMFNSRRFMYTKITSRNLHASKFEVKFRDHGRAFVIKNSGEPIYASGDGSSPRNVYSWTQGSMDDDEAAWFTFEVVDDKNVRIYNRKYKEYLFSLSDNDGSYRKVLSSSEAATNSLWKLTTCNLPI